MKLIKFEIVNDVRLEITVKKPIFSSYLDAIKKLTEDLHARELGWKYMGWHLDEKKNVVFNFRLLDWQHDIKPYAEIKEVLKNERKSKPKTNTMARGNKTSNTNVRLQSNNKGNKQNFRGNKKVRKDYTQRNEGKKWLVTTIC